MQTKTYSQHTKSAVHKGHVHSSLHHAWTVWFQQILWRLCGYACDCSWCECDLIEQNLVMRHVSHRYKLVWTKKLLFTLKCLLSFSEEHVCIKNGVFYENHKVVIWQWPPSLGYTYWFTIMQGGHVPNIWHTNSMYTVYAHPVTLLTQTPLYTHKYVHTRCALFNRLRRLIDCLPRIDSQSQGEMLNQLIVQ